MELRMLLIRLSESCQFKIFQNLNLLYSGTIADFENLDLLDCKIDMVYAEKSYIVIHLM